MIFTWFGPMPAPGLERTSPGAGRDSTTARHNHDLVFTLLIDDVLAICNFSAFPSVALTDAVISVVIGG
jgi:hypothetical protein